MRNVRDAKQFWTRVTLFAENAEPKSLVFVRNAIQPLKAANFVQLVELPDHQTNLSKRFLLKFESKVENFARDAELKSLKMSKSAPLAAIQCNEIVGLEKKINFRHKRLAHLYPIRDLLFYS